MGTRYGCWRALAVCGLLSVSTAAAGNGFESGVTFLQSQQLPDGSISGADDIATPEQATGEALRVLDPASAAYGAALGFLEPETLSAAPTEFLARRLIAGGQHPQSRSALLARQMPDGGFGAFDGHPSNVLDSAYALQALAAQGVGDASAGIAWLEARQLPNGAWPGVDGSASVFVTAQALSSLWDYRHQGASGDTLAAAIAYLLAARGGHDLWTELHESALTLATVAPTLPDETLLSAAADGLQQAQSADGSWAGDAYITAVALRALRAIDRGYADRSLVVGRIIDGDNDTGIPGASVTLTGAHPSTVSSEPGGAFSLAVDLAGSYQLTIAAAGYPAVTTPIAVIHGETLDLGTIRLLREGDAVAGFIQGTVRDAAGNPLVGASVDVAGLATTTASDGTYLLTGIPPGSFSATASKAGYESAVLTGTLAPGGAVLFSPRLRSGLATTFRLSGFVSDLATGAPVAGAAIAVPEQSGAIEVTNASGAYELSGLTPGLVTVVVSHDDYHTASRAFDAEANQHIQYSPTLRPAAEPGVLEIAGTVTDQFTGQPLDSVLVALAHALGTAHVMTDPAGRFDTVVGASETVTATFTRGDYHPRTVELETAGIATFEVNVALLADGVEQARLVGRLVDAETATPLAGAGAAVSHDGGTVNTTTDSDGAFELAPAPVGIVTLDFAADGYHDSTVMIEITKGGTVHLGDWPLNPDVPPEPMTVFGVVVNSQTNEPIAAATVSVVGHAVFTTDVDGTFAFDALPGAAIEWGISAVGFVPVNYSVYIDADTPDLGQIRLRPEGLDNVLPDLRVHSVSRPTPASDADSFYVSGTVDVELTLVGTAIDAPSVRTVAFHDADGDGAFDATVDALLGEITIPGEEFGVEPVMRAIPVSGVLPFRDAPISVFVDAGGVVVEKDESNNVRSTALLCRRVPDPSAELTVRTKWHWQGSEQYPDTFTVYGPIMVGQLTDDNGDGVIDENDIPDLVFIAGGGGVTLLTAISGDDGRTLWQVPGPFTPLGSVAIADLTGNGVVDIVLPSNNRRRLFAYDHTGAPLWDVATSLFQFTNPRDSVAIADLDGDGSPEIIHGHEVRRADGQLWWRGTVSGSGGYDTYGFLPIVADVNLDGRPEVILGRAVYSYDGQLKWQGGNDGFTAVGNFDDDDYAEIVVVARGRITLRNHDGTIKWGPVSLPSRPFSNPGDGGAPTIADFDGDGTPNIGVAAAWRYTVFNADGSIKWVREIVDTSSHKTGSSVFDFNGDGKMEVVYADQEKLFIFDGATGVSRLEIPNVHATTLEYPVIADIDNNGSAEIVIGSTGGATRGVRALESDGTGWMPTRSIWNQHSYHITNINDDGTVPAHEEPSWLVHNTYRANAFVDRDPLDSPDLTIGRLRITDNGAGAALALTARVGNAGMVPSAAPAVVRFFDGPDASATPLGSVTLGAIAPGAWRDIELTGIESLSGGVVTAVIDAGSAFDCDTSNDSIQQAALPTRGSVTVATDASQYAPEQTVTVGATVENTGTFARDYTVEIRIEDADGNLVEALGVFAAEALEPGATQVVTAAWNTGLILAGEYQIRTILHDADGTVLAESTTTFVIAHDAASGPAAALRVATDRPRYHTTDTVVVDLLAQNQSASTLLGASSVEVTIMGPSGPVFDETLAVHELTPGSHAALLSIQDLAAAAVGDYGVAATWRIGGGAVLAVGTASYQVHEDLTQSLKGSVTLSAPEVHRGEPLLCTQRVSNAGTLVASVPLRQVITAVDESDLRIGQARDANIAPGADDTFVATVATGDLGEVHHACIVQVDIEGEWVSLAHAVFEVLPVPIQIDAALIAGERGRLLMLLDPACDDRDPPQQGGDCDADPFGPPDAPPLPVQRAHLEAVLADAGWHVTTVTNATIFEAEFASRAYEVYALFNESVKLPEALQQGVVADVAAGRGLLVAGDHDRRNGRIEEALGIHSLGKNYDITALIVVPLGDHPGGEFTLNVAEKPDAMRLEGAEVIGHYRVKPQGNQAPSLEPGMTRHTFGQGTGIYAGFDLPVQSTMEGDDGEFADLLTATMSAVHRVPYVPVAGRVFPLKLLLQNEGIAVAGQVHLTLPPGTLLVEGPQNTSVAGELVTWPFTLAEDELATQTLWIRLPENPGWMEIEALVLTPDDDELIERARVQILLNVQPKE